MDNAFGNFLTYYSFQTKFYSVERAVQMFRIGQEQKSIGVVSRAAGNSKRVLCFERLEAREYLNADFELLYKVPYDVFSNVLLPDLNDQNQVIFFDPKRYQIDGNSAFGRMQVITGKTAEDMHPISSPGLGQMVRELRFPDIARPKLSNSGLAVIWGKVQKLTTIEQRLLVHDTIKSIDVSALDTGGEFKKFGKFDATDDGAVFIGEKTNEFGGVYLLKANGAVTTLFERKFAYDYLDSVQVSSSGSISVWYNGQVLELREGSEPIVLAGRLREYANVTISKIVKDNGYSTTFQEGDTIEVSVAYSPASYTLPASMQTGYRVGIRTRSLTTKAFSPVDQVLSFDAINQTQKITIDLYGDQGYDRVKKSFLVELYDLKEDPFQLYHVGIAPGELISFNEAQREPAEQLFLRRGSFGTFIEPKTGTANLESLSGLSFRNDGPQSAYFSYEVVPWTALPGRDYVETSGFVSLSRGDSPAKYSVPILADKIDDPVRYAFMVYSSPSATLSLPEPSLITIRDYSWPEIPRDFSRSNDGAIVFKKPSDVDSSTDVFHRYVPLDAADGTTDRFTLEGNGKAYTLNSFNSLATYAGNGFRLVKWTDTNKETIFGNDSPIAGYSVRSFEEWTGFNHFSLNNRGQVVFGAKDDVISADGKKWIAVFRSVISAPRLEIVSMEEVPSDPNQRPFSNPSWRDASHPHPLEARYTTDFSMDLKVVLKNTGNASSGPILAEYFRYTTTNGNRSQPWSIGIAPKNLVAIDEKGESKQFNGIEPGEEVTLYFQDIESPIFDENISKDFQGERGKHETNILHELKLKPANLRDEVLSVTTSASTDHQNYRSEGEDFLSYLINNDFFSNAANLYNRFLNGNGTPLVSPAASKLAGDIGDSSIYAEWLKKNVLSAAIAEVRKIISEGGKAGEYTLKFGGRDVPQENLYFPFGRVTIPTLGDYTYPTDLGMAIGGTQPNAPSANGSSDTIGGQVKLVIDSIPFPVPETFSGNFRLLTTLRDLYQFDHGDNLKSRLNVFARGQQISGEAEWFHHEFTVESRHSFIFENGSKSETKPGDHSVLDVGSAKGINGELLLSPVIDQARPAATLSALTEPNVTSVQIGVARNSFETLLGTGALHLFGRSGVEWKEIGSQAITAQSTLTTDLNGEVVFSVKLDKSGLAQTPFELGFAFISTASAPIPLAITFIQFYEDAPELYLQSIGLSPNDNVIRFGDATQGADTQDLFLANSGNSELVISRVQVSGNHFEVELSGVIFPLILLPGEKRIFSLSFDGSAPASGKLRVDWNSPTGFSEFLLDASANEGVPSIISDLDFHVSDKSYSLLDIRTYDSDSSIVRLEVDEPATHVLVVDSGRIAFVPRADDPPSFVLPFKLKASDTGFPRKTSEYEGTISINAPNAQPDEVAAWTDRTTKLNLLANDTNPIGDLGDMRIINSMPQFGRLSFNADGVSYLPNTGTTSSTDEFTYRLVNSYGVASRNATVKIWLVDPAAKIFHNANLKEDVDGDGNVWPLDALLVINQLNIRSLNNPNFGMLQPMPPASIRYLLDTNGDNFLSPLDALIVINWLNRRSLESAEGEESVDLTEMSFTTAVNNVDASFVGLGLDWDINDHENSLQKLQNNSRLRRKPY